MTGICRERHLICHCTNIMRKVATQLGLNLAEVGRGALILPQRIDGRVDGGITSPHLSFRTGHESFQPHPAPAYGCLSTIVRWIAPLDLDSYSSPFPLTALVFYLDVRRFAFAFHGGSYPFIFSSLYA